jgi:hypothetical protein
MDVVAADISSIQNVAPLSGLINTTIMSTPDTSGVCGFVTLSTPADLLLTSLSGTTGSSFVVSGAQNITGNQVVNGNRKKLFLSHLFVL